MKLPNAAHEARPWRITGIAPDFKLLDTWNLPVEGTRGDFDAFLDTMAVLDLARTGPRAVRALFSLRARLGQWFGWNDCGWGEGTIKLAIPGCTETTLSARLPKDLQNTVPAPDNSAVKFRPIYRTDDEWAEELSNGIVHVIKHLVWIDEGRGHYRGQMGIYVKTRGWFGPLYLALIQPFRHAIVYPAGIRQIKHAWETRSA
ncbi:MAG TPA: DUF2867 domain-containing protein [Bryobacteraceae bacterium]|nr:DUF2867 domain-containing protein [Bryobacteraceae bacterium]